MLGQNDTGHMPWWIVSRGWGSLQTSLDYEYPWDFFKTNLKHIENQACFAMAEHEPTFLKWVNTIQPLRAFKFKYVFPNCGPRPHINK